MATTNSVGVFHEGEIDGKPFHIYTFSTQTHIPSSSSFSGEATIDSGRDKDLPPPQPLFLCPSIRNSARKLKERENGRSYDDFLPFNTPPHFPNITSSDQQVQSLLDSDSNDDICKLPVLPLFWCNNKNKYKDNRSLSNCKACDYTCQIGTDYYFCTTCDCKSHKECVESPLEIKHPSYPFLTLKLYMSSERFNSIWRCISCQNSVTGMVFHCPTSNFIMHPFCAMKPIPIFINHPKRHPHSLTFFPKQKSLQCSVCGVIRALMPTYVCARCVFVVHQDCIYFPYVIRISCHQHRISFVYSLPSGELSCGVCRQKVDNDCGGYSCNKCADYFVHSRCAIRRDLWDGEELEGVPEEPEIVLEPFEKIADGIILHFSHGHNLKLEISTVYDEDKYCQACIIPIYEGSYYSCADHCDFILHETCANTPLKKHHPLHARSLELKVVTSEYNWNQGYFSCDACRRESCGFVYDNLVGGQRFKLDLRCASVSEPFTYEGHEHPLFLALKPEEERSAICKICQDTGNYSYSCRKLNCIECNYVICFKCALPPYKARYKHDKHLLTFRDGKEASHQSGWCEVCERKIVYSEVKGFYTCDDYCCTTLHVSCLLGKNPYMKPGYNINIYQEEVNIVRNNTMSRPFCHGSRCDGGRCLYKVFFKNKNKNKTLCTYSCAVYMV